MPHAASVGGIASEAVIEEARRRQQRRHCSVGAALLTLAVAAGGYVGAVRGSGGGMGAANVAAPQHAPLATARPCPAPPANALIITTQPHLRGSHFRPKSGLHVQSLPRHGAELWISPDRAAGSSAGTFCASS